MLAGEHWSETAWPPRRHKTGSSSGGAGGSPGLSLILSLPSPCTTAAAHRQRAPLSPGPSSLLEICARIPSSRVRVSPATAGQPAHGLWPFFGRRGSPPERRASNDDNAGARFFFPWLNGAAAEQSVRSAPLVRHHCPSPVSGDPLVRSMYRPGPMTALRRCQPRQ